MCGFCCLGMILFSVYLFWRFLTFCFADVVALALTMRTLCHLGVGVESHAPVFLQKVFTNSKKNFLLCFFPLGVLYYI